MNADTVLRIVREALVITLILSGPAVIVATLVGLAVSIVQAATQVQEQLLTVAPKLVAVFAVLVFAGLWMVTTLARFAAALLELIPSVT